MSGQPAACESTHRPHRFPTGENASTQRLLRIDHRPQPAIRAGAVSARSATDRLARQRRRSAERTTQARYRQCEVASGIDTGIQEPRRTNNCETGGQVSKIPAILSLLHQESIPASSTRLFREQSVLRWTLQRLSQCESLGKATILCWANQFPALRGYE